MKQAAGLSTTLRTLAGFPQESPYITLRFIRRLRFVDPDPDPDFDPDSDLLRHLRFAPSISMGMRHYGVDVTAPT